MAVTTLTAPNPWRARHTTIHIAKASMMPDLATATTSALFCIFDELSDSTNNPTQSGDTPAKRVEALFKNVTITPPEMPYDKQDLLGTDQNDFQNAVLDKKPAGEVTASGTALLGTDEALEYFLDLTGIDVTDASYGDSSRYQLGDDDLPEVAVLITNRTSTKSVAFTLTNARAVKWGDVRIGGPDTHWEMDVTFKCLPKDFYWEYLD